MPASREPRSRAAASRARADDAATGRALSRRTPATRSLPPRRFEILDFQPPGDAPRFDARYDPATGVLSVVYRVAFEFRDGRGQRWTEAEQRGWSQRAFDHLSAIEREPLHLQATDPGFEELPPVRLRVNVGVVDAAAAHATIRVDRDAARQVGNTIGPRMLSWTDLGAALAAMTGLSWVVGYPPQLAAAPRSSGELEARLRDLDAELARPHSIGHCGALHAERIDLASELSAEQTGRAPKTDCISYVLDVLKQAFSSAGRADDWERVRRVAYARTRDRYPDQPRKRISGIDLMTALIDLGWEPFFIIADTDPQSHENREFDHHLVEHKMARADVPLHQAPNRAAPGVRPRHMIADYSPHRDSLRETNAIAMSQLRRLPLAFLAMNGGQHTALLAHGTIYDAQEISDTEPQRAAIRAVDLARWGYRSALGVAPAEDVERAFDLGPRDGATDPFTRAMRKAD